VRGLPSLLGGLGLVALGFGLLSALLAIFQPVTDLSWVIGNLAVGAGLLTAAFFTGFDSIRQRMRSGEARRVGKYGSSAIVSTLLTLAILAMLGFLSQRHAVRFDWSESKVNTLTEQTSSLLARLEADVVLTAFFDRSEVPDVAALLDRYAYESDRVDVAFIDPNSSPLLVEELGLDPEALAKGLLRIESGGKALVVTDLSESGITNGLLKLRRSSSKKIYFLTGHNERPIAEPEGEPAKGKEALGRAAEALRNETYQVEALSMATRGEVPEDADALVIGGPTRPFFEHEIAALTAYAARGGSILFLIDPRAQTNLGDLLREWEIELGDDVVVDQVQAIFNQATSPLAAGYAPDHPGDPPADPLPDGAERAGERRWVRGHRVHRPELLGRARSGRMDAHGAGRLRRTRPERPGSDRRGRHTADVRRCRHGGRGRGPGGRVRRFRLRVERVHRGAVQPRPVSQCVELAGRRRGADLDPAAALAGLALRTRRGSVPRDRLSLALRPARGHRGRRRPRVVAAPRTVRSMTA